MIKINQYSQNIQFGDIEVLWIDLSYSNFLNHIHSLDTITIIEKYGQSHVLKTRKNKHHILRSEGVNNCSTLTICNGRSNATITNT